METETEENKKTKKVLIILSELALIVLGVIFLYAVNFKRSLPLGILLISGGLFAFCLVDFLAIVSLARRETLSLRKIKRAIGFLITGILAACMVGVSGYDLVKGPQKVVLKDAHTTSKRVRKERIWENPRNTYIAGKTKDGKSLKIHIEDEDITKVRTVLLKGKQNVTVYYYKGLRVFYDIETED